MWSVTRLDITMMQTMTCTINTVYSCGKRFKTRSESLGKFLIPQEPTKRHPYARSAEPTCIMANALALFKAARGPNACAQMSWTFAGHTPSKSAANVSHAAKVVGAMIGLFASRRST